MRMRYFNWYMSCQRISSTHIAALYDGVMEEKAKRSHLNPDEAAIRRISSLLATWFLKFLRFLILDQINKLKRFACFSLMPWYLLISECCLMRYESHQTPSIQAIACLDAAMLILCCHCLLGIFVNKGIPLRSYVNVYLFQFPLIPTIFINICSRAIFLASDIDNSFILSILHRVFSFQTEKGQYSGCRLCHWCYNSTIFGDNLLLPYADRKYHE